MDVAFKYYFLCFLTINQLLYTLKKRNIKFLSLKSLNFGSYFMESAYQNQNKLFFLIRNGFDSDAQPSFRSLS